MSKVRPDISRRAVVLSAGMLAASAAVKVGVAGQETKKIPWDQEADIVCVGSGAAAITAAAIALGNGDQVIVLEKEKRLGGTTAKSGAVHWICNNPTLRAAGITDERLDALKYMVRFSYPNNYVADHPTLGVTEEEFSLIAAFYDNGAPMVDRLQEMGVYTVAPWNLVASDASPNPNSAPIATSTPDYLEHAQEDKVKSGRPIAMVIGDVKTSHSAGGGVDFIEAFAEFVRKKKGILLIEHRAIDLITNARNEVVGLVAVNGGKQVRIRARKAVIFGTGGFAQNPQLMRRFLKTVPFGSCSAHGSEGDILPIVSRVGAALGNMPNAWWANVPIEQSLKSRTFGSVMFFPTGDSMIFVNKYGKRFVDEYRSYSSRGKSYQIWNSTEEEYSNHVSFMIFDQRTSDLYGGNNPIPPPGELPYWVIKAQTLDDLAQSIGARLETLRSHSIGVGLAPDFAKALKKTVENFNGYATSGIDPEFGRGKHDLDRQFFASMSSPHNVQMAKGLEFMKNWTMYPLASAGPYYAILIGLGVLDTTGGPVVNSKAQIVDYAGKPIPGLYGAGNCIAAPTGEAYYGPGGTVGPAMTYGYIAANSAHLEPIKALS
jgi:3-oxosteroid 1-dehydrogenase